MSVVVCNSSGDLAGAIWDRVTNTPTMHATTNISVSTSNLFSATFTAPNTTNAVKGVLIPVSVFPTISRDWTITLQQSGVDTAAVATFAGLSSSTGLAPYYLYFKFASPFTFTTTSAGAYRYKLVSNGAASSGTVAADAGGANFAYASVDDRAGSAANNELFIIAPNQGTGYTVTHTGTNTIGNNLDTTTAPTARSWGMACVVGYGSVLAMDTTASNTLTHKGHIFMTGGGELRAGTVASPVPSSTTVTLIGSAPAAISTAQLKAYEGKMILQGAIKTFYKTTLVSGDGTTATPLVTADTTGWAIDDEIAIGTTRNSSDNEIKYIKTITGTSLTLANTAGGAEAGLVNTHDAGAVIANLTRNVIVAGSSSSATTIMANQTVTTPGNIDFDWVRFDLITTIGVANGAGTVGNMDYCVFTRTSTGILIQTTKVPITMTGNIVANTLGAGNAPILGHVRFLANCNNKTLNDFLVFSSSVANGREGIAISAYNVTMNRCMVLGGNLDRRSVGGGSFVLNAAGSVTLNDCKAIGHKYASVNLFGATDVVFNNFTSTSTESGMDDVYTGADTYMTALFNDSTFVGSSLVNNYPNAIPGSIVKFHRYQDTDNTHIWYTVNGKGQSTGAGLADTTVRTPGSLSVRLAPETSDGSRHTFQVIAKPNTYVGVSGFVRMNTAFAGSTNTSLSVELYLPGSTVADATQTISKVDGVWQAYNIGAVYSGATYGYATVYVRAVNADGIAGAYIYHDDIYNGTNPITAIDVWDAGQPSPIMFEQLGDAAAVWNVATSGLTTAGTTGNLLRKLLTVAKFLALK